MIIVRSETKEIERLNKWVMIFGRRKTGKSFLAKNFLKYDEYFFVKRDKTLISERDGTEISYDTFISLLKRGLEENKRVVVDEFHRLGDDFLDTLHSMGNKGSLIIISSTMYLSKKLIDNKSAALGLFAEMPLWIISMKDTLAALKKYKLTKKEMVELGIILREPITIDYFREGADPREMASEVLMHSIQTVPALIGEIFLEEDRTISAVYEGILRAVANGKITSSEISSDLFSRKLISKDDPSSLQQYLANLLNFGVLKKIARYGKNRFVYKHISPLVEMFYYADEKYNISERKPNREELERIVNDIMPGIVEDNIREFLAEKYGLTETLFEGKDFDIDVYLLKFKKPEIAVEVKWKERIDEAEIARIKDNMSRIEAKKKYLFVPDKSKISAKGIDVVDITDFC